MQPELLTPLNSLNSKTIQNNIIMSQLQKLLMTISLLFIVICLAVCIYFSVALPSNDPNAVTFYVMTAIFGFAAVWFTITFIKSLKK